MFVVPVLFMLAIGFFFAIRKSAREILHNLCGCCESLGKCASSCCQSCKDRVGECCNCIGQIPGEVMERIQHAREARQAQPEAATVTVQPEVRDAAVGPVNESFTDLNGIEVLDNVPDTPPQPSAPSGLWHTSSIDPLAPPPSYETYRNYGVPDQFPQSVPNREMVEEAPPSYSDVAEGRGNRERPDVPPPSYDDLQ